MERLSKKERMTNAFILWVFWLKSSRARSRRFRPLQSTRHSPQQNAVCFRPFLPDFVVSPFQNDAFQMQCGLLLISIPLVGPSAPSRRALSNPAFTLQDFPLSRAKTPTMNTRRLTPQVRNGLRLSMDGPYLCLPSNSMPKTEHRNLPHKGNPQLTLRTCPYKHAFHKSTQASYRWGVARGGRPLLSGPPRERSNRAPTLTS
jgi:hypothetical protein